MKNINKGFMMILGLLVLLAGCSVNASEKTVFPKREDSWVGDPMPYYDGNQFRIFYLDDLRDSAAGFHPWSLFTTDDFVHYEDNGIVIPYSEDTSDQDNALGTGSVIKDEDGLYHAFYTGFNGRKFPQEAVMHATSEDMIEWDKQPENTFYAPDHYSGDDFRDPYVFWNDEYGEYWMLLTTRKDNMGVIALYTSNDLISWEDDGVLFENDMGTDSNLECPTLIYYNGYWYLSFSDQWPDRVTHYRIADKSKGEFLEPEQDYFDGRGFYAGRIEKDEENLYLFGWVPTKERYNDHEDYDWGGNLVVHQLKQKENGELYPTPVESVTNKFKKKQKLPIKSITETIQQNNDTFEFSGKDYEFLKFEPFSDSNMIKGSIDIKEIEGKFGFNFNVSEDKHVGTLNVVLDIERNQIQFYNQSTELILSEKPQAFMEVDLQSKDKIDFTLFLEESVAVLHINDEAILSNRIFSSRNRDWGFFGIDSEMKLNNLEMWK